MIKMAHNDAGQWARELSWGVESEENNYTWSPREVKLWYSILNCVIIEHIDTCGFWCRHGCSIRVAKILEALSKEMTVLFE